MIRNELYVRKQPFMTRKKKHPYRYLKDANQEELNNVLPHMVYGNNIDGVRYVLTSPELSIHADIYYNSCLALHHAITQQYMDILDYLLQSSELNNHADLTNVNGEHALTDACKYSALLSVQYLLETPGIRERIDINLEGGLPLSYAIECHHVDIMRYLLTSSQLLKKADMKLHEARLLECAFLNKDIQWLKFLFTSKELAEPLDFVKYESQLSAWCIENKNMELYCDILTNLPPLVQTYSEEMHVNL